MKYSCVWALLKSQRATQGNTYCVKSVLPSSASAKDIGKSPEVIWNLDNVQCNLPALEGWRIWATLLEIKTDSREARCNNQNAWISVTFPLGNWSYLYIENCQAAIFFFFYNASEAKGFCFVLNAAETLFPWTQIICAESQVSSWSKFYLFRS